MDDEMPESAFPILETARFRLRGLDEGDADALLEIMRDPEVTRWYDVEAYRGREDSQRAIRRFAQRFRDRQGFRWGIERKDDGRLVGHLGFVEWNAPNRWARLGYLVRRLDWGKGVASETVPMVVDYGFRDLRLNRIEAEVVPANEASTRLLERMGFVREGLLRERIWKPHGPLDVAVYALVRPRADGRTAAGNAP